MPNSTIEYKELPPGQEAPIDLLLLADPDIDQINTYLREGLCFIAEKEKEIIGILAFKKHDDTTWEIANVAIKESFQGKGIGSQLISYSLVWATVKGAQVMQIATGNSSIGQLYLYQKLGFEIYHIEFNHFLQHYPEPIWESGIQCKHQIRLQKFLPS